MKKSFLMGICMVLLALTMVACGTSKPSEAEIREALEKGNITIADALEKGWVDEAWVSEHTESVPAADKTTTNLLGAFKTTDLAGNEFDSGQIEANTFIAFFNPKEENGLAQYTIVNEAYDGIIQNGGQVLGVVLGDEGIDQLQDSQFTIVYYNDAFKEAMGSLDEMVDGATFSGSWNVNKAFLSAWNMKVEKNKLVEAAKSFSQMAVQQTTKSAENSSAISMN